MTAGTTPHTSETTTGVDGGRRRARQRRRSRGRSVRGHRDRRLHRPGRAAPFDCTLTGGAVSTSTANGEFSYTPAPGATSGSFTYTVTDTPAQGLPASVTGTVTFTFFDMIWYVDADAAAGGNGTSRLPFNTFTAATLSGAAGAGDLDDADDYIFVHGASAVIATGIGLEASQHLIRRAGGAVVINRVPQRQRRAGHPGAGERGAAPVHQRRRGQRGRHRRGRRHRSHRAARFGPTVNAIDLTTAAAVAGRGHADHLEQRDRQRRRRRASTSTSRPARPARSRWRSSATRGTRRRARRQRRGHQPRGGDAEPRVQQQHQHRSVQAAGARRSSTAAPWPARSSPAFANNTVHRQHWRAGVTIANVTFDADSPGGGVQQVDRRRAGDRRQRQPGRHAGLTLTDGTGQPVLRRSRRVRRDARA